MPLLAPVTTAVRVMGTLLAPAPVRGTGASRRSRGLLHGLGNSRSRAPGGIQRNGGADVRGGGGSRRGAGLLELRTEHREGGNGESAEDRAEKGRALLHYEFHFLPGSGSRRF